MTNFRALCAELLLFAEQAGEMCHNEGLWPDCDQQPICVDGKPLWLLDRVRAALMARPAPNYDRVAEIATEGEIRAAAQYLVKKKNCDGDLVPAIRYAIARWGCSAPAPQPIPVTERLPGPADCDANGMCWWYFPAAERWLRCGIPNPDPTSQVHAYWLPADAIPLPQSEFDD